MYDAAFPKRFKTIKSTDAPWMNSRIRRLIRNKKRYYMKHGRTAVWRKKCKKLNSLIRNAKRTYLEKIKAIVLDTNNSRGYYRAVKMFQSAGEAPRPWAIQNLSLIHI